MNNIKKIITANIHWSLRITLAITFFIHGYPKVVEIGKLKPLFSKIGLPEFFAYFVGPFEVLGALFLLIGPFINEQITKIGALLIIIIMLGAIFTVHVNDGWAGNEWQILIVCTCLLFLVKGNDV